MNRLITDPSVFFLLSVQSYDVTHAKQIHRIDFVVLFFQIRIPVIAFCCESYKGKFFHSVILFLRGMFVFATEERPSEKRQAHVLFLSK